ncbi:hypothetical protein H310_08028 [Aphanomyces invadans]|uniref:Short transient receptor potential channel 4-associated protein n=1 Tax=Aphanomyces invadans TaxID=157072 RepID=A0A024U084_9STRA|nr:hypothetical protein H310_08028 [Aphanomyces invadans]ETV99296.1 hypothetical protein H310_08028 [Aphanomyces invadans]|eukprot:XP_008871852.1 hypothetical protein H310_08028 [Aphanomyces invadans]
MSRQPRQKKDEAASASGKKSMFHRVRQAQITGRVTTWRALPSGSMGSGLRGMPLLVHPNIDSLLPVLGAHPKRLLKQMNHIDALLNARKLSDVVVPLQTLSRSIVPPSGVPTRKEDRDNFIQMGGPELLQRILFAILRDRTMELFPGARAPAMSSRPLHYSYREESARRRSRMAGSDVPTQDKLTALAEALNFLRELCFVAPSLAEELGQNDKLTIVLFQLMGNTIFFEHAAGLVEEILSVRDVSFDLSLVPDFHATIQTFSSRQLAFFCRILALVVFEPEDRRLLENSRVIKSVELLRLRRERMHKADNTVDRNHALLFRAPAVLNRLMLVLQLQNYFFAINPAYDPYSQEIQSSTEWAMLFSLEQQEEWEMLSSPTVATVLREAMENADAPENATSSADQSLFNLSSTYFRSLMSRQRLQHQRSVAALNRSDVEAELLVKSIALAPFRVEVLFVICTLLSSKRKVDFQDTLAEMGLVDILNQMFLRLKWNEPPPTPPSQPLHGPGCECSMDASLKIQFLRLIHNFCDRDVQDHSNKLLLLSPDERRSVQTGDRLDPARLDKGLLCKIIDVLVVQPADSIYRFWLASCVESFLRRSSPAEQLFVARSPLLAALLKEILSCGFKPSGSLQSAFDLLGEMTKNNPTTLVILCDSMDDYQFASFMQVVVANLVDSNVFVRSVLLSVENHPRTMELYPSLSRVFEFLRMNTVRLLRNLMSIITMDDINHENICCLNTAVVMLVFEFRKHRLPRMLEALRQQEAEVGDSAVNLCLNFRTLLWFWIQYYIPRGRDRLSLEHSSDMKFKEWYHVVALLCADDGSPSALLPAPTLLPATPYLVHHMTNQPTTCPPQRSRPM